MRSMAEAVTVPVVAVVKEAAGYKLFLSSKSVTGYMGVSKHAAGRFWASYYDSALANTVSLGTYDTAVEAAVAYAKHMAAEVMKDFEQDSNGVDLEMSAAVEEEKPAKRKLPFEDVTVDTEPMTTAVVTKTS